MADAETSRGRVPDPDADVIIVGAGPAGMAAAAELADAGCSVIVLDLQPSPGGQIYRGLESNLADKAEQADLLAALGPSYSAGSTLIRRFREATSIDYRTETAVWELRADGTVGWLRGSKAGYLRGRHVLLATGAMERPTPFPGWTLPGVMTAGAVQTLLKAGRLKPQGNIILAGTGPLILLLSEQLRRLGVRPAVIARTDQMGDSLKAIRYLCPNAVVPLVKGLGWLARLRLANIRLVSGISGLVAEGAGKVETVGFYAGGRWFSHPCDLLVVHDGIVPAIDLAHGAGIALEWNSAGASWQPTTSIDGTATVRPDAGMDNQPCRIRITGDARRIGGADAAIAHGKLAASAILLDLKKADIDTGRGAKAAVNKALAVRPFLDAAFPPGLSADPLDDDTIVCRCEELTAGVLRAQIIAEGRDIDRLRGETRCGMGPCQGRNCMITVARLVSETGPASDLAPLPTFRARPPMRPLPLGALATLTGLGPSSAETRTLDDKPQYDAGETDHARAS